MKNAKAFTLVELIVVITILAILGTIGFISFQGFSQDARDSIRLSDISNFAKLLDYKKLKSGTYPTPDNSIALSSSGNLLGYQGYAGQSVFLKLGYSGDGLDPLDQTSYTYYTLANGSKMQLLGLLEKDSFSYNLINTAHAADERYPKVYGNKLGVITDNNNVPAQSLPGATDIDIIQTSDTYTAHVSDNIKYTGNGDNLRYSVPLSSCQRLADLNLGGGNGYYTIYPIGGIGINVYCRFEDGEGHTLIARSVDNSAFNNTSFGWFVSRGDVTSDIEPYSLGSIVKDIPFKNIYLEVAGNGKERSTAPGLDGVTILNVTDIDLFTASNGTNPIPVNSCIGGGCALFSNWGNFDSQESYYFSPTTTSINGITDLDDLSEYTGNQRDGLNRRRYGSSFPFSGMIFVK